MEILYGRKFSKDLDAIRHATGIKAQLLKLVEVISAAKSFADLKKHILPVPFFILPVPFFKITYKTNQRACYLRWPLFVSG